MWLSDSYVVLVMDMYNIKGLTFSPAGSHSL